MSCRKMYCLILFLTISCQEIDSTAYDYQIISSVLNKSFAHESDLENGDGWIDESLNYNSLKFTYHTKIRAVDFESIKSIFEFDSIPDFKLADFKKYKEWDVSKIKNYYRYKIYRSNESIKEKDVSIGRIQFSNIAYNREFTEAIVFVDFLCGGECGGSNLYFLKRNKDWEVNRIYSLGSN